MLGITSEMGVDLRADVNLLIKEGRDFDDPVVFGIGRLHVEDHFDDEVG